MLNADETLKLYSRIIRDIDLVYHNIAVKIGVSDSALHILYFLYTEYSDRDCPIHEIYKNSCMPKQTVCSALKKLADKNIISIPDEKTVVVTDDGRIYLENNIKPLFEIEKSIIGSWSDDELDCYIDLNLRFLNQLKERTQQHYD